ncbi:SH3 domain-containing protein [Streptomyces sp. NPDC005551]|uniref:SH3 domain-containing protein n=1 Tax=unclassified Streptomyces TaxID=2593676 RepID=UPI00340F5F0C
MTLRSTRAHLGTVAAGGALAMLVATTAAAVADGRDSHSDSGESQVSSSQDHNDTQGWNEGGQGWNNIGRDWNHDGNHSPSLYTGRVTARGGLVLRDAPARGSAVIRVEPYGATVHILCRTSGERVGHDNLWYLLTDGTWAWGSAKHIDTIGAAPRRC